MSIQDLAVTWFKAARAPFLVVSLVPAILGGLVAWRTGPVDGWLFAVVTLGVVMAHSAADFVDDWFDFRKGNLGNKEKQFHDSPLIDGRVTPGQVMAAALACLAVALACGVYALVEAGPPVLVPMGIGLFIVFFYTSPPFALNYRGLGETALFLAFGPLIVVGIYYVLRGTFALEPLLASVPLGIFTMNVGLVSNTFDHDDDVRSGKRTLALRLGQAGAVRLLAVLSGVAYLVVAVGVAVGAMTPWALLVIATLPLAIQVVRRTARYRDTSHYTGAMGRAIALSTVAGLLLSVAYGFAIALASP